MSAPADKAVVPGSLFEWWLPKLNGGKSGSLP